MSESYPVTYQYESYGREASFQSFYSRTSLVYSAKE